MNKRSYGWKPDLPDIRDHTYGVEATRALPKAVDLRHGCPPVYDQGQLGSCTANAIAAAFEFDLKRQSLPEFTPSRLFIYFNERAMEGTIQSDSGANIRDGIKTLKTRGVVPESDWPYDVTRFADRPSLALYAEAKSNQALAYKRIDHTVLHSLLAALASGLPIVFGFTVYESFESPEVAESGLVPMPKHGEQVLGGHAVLLVGYDQGLKRFLVRNSWGPAWGEGGYCWFPFEYLMNPNLADDFWVVQSVE